MMARLTSSDSGASGAAGVTAIDGATGLCLGRSVIVPDPGALPQIDSARGSEAGRGISDETEIRLTYRELSALIEDAIRSLR